MSSRKLRVESVTHDGSGLGSRVLVVFNRNLTPMEVKGFELLVSNLVERSNDK